jgi:N-acetylglucosamine-6-phosphate deacetylase
MRTVLTAQRLWDGVRLLDWPVVVIEDGWIASISSRAAVELPTDARVLDFPGATLAPAFFDVHIHGAMGHDVMEATPAALDAMGSFLAAHGTGSFLATTVTAPLDATLRSLSGLAKLLAQPPVKGRAQASAFIWKARFSPMQSAACSRRSICLRPTRPPSTGSSRPPRAASG